MAGNFNYPFINQFSHHAAGNGQAIYPDQAAVAAAQYYGSPIFNQLNWMMQSQGGAAVVHCKLIGTIQ